MGERLLTADADPECKDVNEKTAYTHALQQMNALPDKNPKREQFQKMMELLPPQEPEWSLDIDPVYQQELKFLEEAKANAGKAGGKKKAKGKKGKKGKKKKKG